METKLHELFFLHSFHTRTKYFKIQIFDLTYLKRLSVHSRRNDQCRFLFLHPYIHAEKEICAYMCIGIYLFCEYFVGHCPAISTQRCHERAYQIPLLSRAFISRFARSTSGAGIRETLSAGAVRWSRIRSGVWKRTMHYGKWLYA